MPSKPEKGKGVRSEAMHKEVVCPTCMFVMGLIIDRVKMSVACSMPGSCMVVHVATCNLREQQTSWHLLWLYRRAPTWHLIAFCEVFAS